MSVSQEIFNQYREAKIVEILQAIAQSEAGNVLAFKGGTALRLFWGLPRFSQDMDFTLREDSKRDAVFKGMLGLAESAGYEITDSAKKFKTVLFEFRFQWEGPTFRLKIEIASPTKPDLEMGGIPVQAASLRGVPVMVLQEDRLTAQKLCAFLDRNAARDVYDFWFILDRHLKIDWAYVKRYLGLDSEKDFFTQAKQKIESIPKTRLLNDVGKLLSPQERLWLKTGFLADLKALLLKREATRT